MTSKFRENVNLWGTVIFGCLMFYGAVSTAIYRFGNKSDSTEKSQKNPGKSTSVVSNKVSLLLSTSEQEEVKNN